MSTPQNDRAEGTIDRIKGKAQKIYGEIADDDRAKARGELDKLKGSAKQAKADVKDKLHEKINKI